MPDVVGSAYVTIRAITSNLSKEIEKGVKKGVKDADVESSGGLIGDDLVKGASRKIKDGLGEAVGDATKNIDKKVDVDGGRRLGDRLGEGIKSGLSAALDSKAFSAISSRILKLIGLDESAGKKKGRGFGRGFLGAIAKFGVLFSPAILGLGSLLVQYVTALVSQVGLLAVAAAGAGVALGTVFGAAGLAIIPLVLAFKANTAQLARFKKVAEGVGKQFLEIGAATQETLLPGLTRALKLSTKLIPAFRGFGYEVGRTAGFFAELAVGEVAGDQERLRTILQGSGRIFANLAGFARNFISIFLDLFKAAIPIGEQFSDALEGMTKRWSWLIRASSNSGRLTEVFQDWYDKAKLVGGALGDLFAAIWNIFTIGSDSAVPFFENFARWAEEFRAFTKSAAGQNRLKQIFDDSLVVAHEFNGLIVDIARRIGAGVFEPGGNEGIIGFIRVLREDVVPFLDKTFRRISEDMGQSLTNLAKSFGKFLTKFGDAGGFKTAIGILGKFFDVLTKILNIPGMDKFLGGLLGIIAALKVLTFLHVPQMLKLIVDGFKLIISVGGAAFSFVRGLIVAQEAVIGVTTGLSVAQAAAAISTGALTVAQAEAAVAAGVLAAAEGTAAVATGTLLLTLLPIVAVVAAVGAAFILFKKDSDVVKEGVDSAKEAFADLKTALKDSLGNVVSDTLGEKDVQSLGKLGFSVQSITDSLLAGRNPLTIFNKGLQDLGLSSKDVTLALSGYSTDTRGFSEAQKRVTEATGLSIKELKSLRGSFEDLVPTTQKAAEEFLNTAVANDILTRSQVDSAIVGGDFLGAVKKLRPAMEKTAAATEGVARTFKSADDAVDAFSGSISKLLGKAFSVEEATDSYADAVEALRVRVLGGTKSLDANTDAGRDNRDAIRNLVSESASVIRAYAESGASADELTMRTVAARDSLVEQLVSMGFARGEAHRYADTLLEIKPAIDTTVKLNVEEAKRHLEEFRRKLGEIGPVIITRLGVSINPHSPGALGGIFKRPTKMLIGEAGPEVLIPLTNPRRALDLFNQSGLASVLAVAQRGRSSVDGLAASFGQGQSGVGSFPTGAGRRGGDLIVQNMNIEAPTPLETARQVSDRLRIMQSQLVSR